MSTPILATKLFVPPVRPELVSRPRLLDKFNAGLHCKATLVSAPAGFGKSTLVGEWAAHGQRSIAWLSLDEADSELLRFLRYLIASIARVEAGFAASVVVSLESQQVPPTDLLLVSLLNELSELQSNLLLVLDDYHLVDSGEVDGALAFLIEHLPPRVHVIVTTREDPQFPLAAWRAKGLLNELRVSELRFTSAEASKFLSQTMHLQLPIESVAALEARTEGWIAGLQLAALSLQGRSDSTAFIEDFAGSHRFVLDYLAEEVLQRQSDAAREFMLHTAILDRLHGPLCDAVTLQSEGTALLQSFERDNLFVMPLDDQRQWFRYHHLFRDVLFARLQQQTTLLPELHKRAADWFAGNGFPSEAIHHLIAAKDEEAAAVLIENTWPELCASTPESTLIAWVQRLPDALLLCRPVLSAHVGLSYLSSDLDRSILFFEAAERYLEIEQGGAGREDYKIDNVEALVEIPGLLAVGRAYQAGATGDMQGIVENAERALRLLDDGAAIWRGAAAVLLGMMYWARGELRAAYSTISNGHKSMLAGGEASGAISTLFMMANLSLALGRVSDAVAHCEQGQRIARERSGPAPQGTQEIYVTLAAIKAEQNRLDEADDLLLQAREQGDQAVLLESRHLWYVVKARIQSCRGEHEQALELLEQASQQQIPSPAPRAMPIETWAARVQLALGRLVAVEEWASARGLSVDDELDYLREYDHLLLLKLLLAQARQSRDQDALQQARAFAERQLTYAHAAGHKQYVMELQILESIVLYELSDTEAALLSLRSALRQAELQGYVRVFVEQGQVMKSLLQLIPASDKSAKTVAVLLAAFTPDQSGQAAASTQAKSAPSGQAAELAEPLSDRELDVLRCLASELSGPEIANQLFVSLNTLRTHSKNIYAKLGVNSRRSAVKRAAELGLR